MLASVGGGIGRIIVSEVTLYVSKDLKIAYYIFYSFAGLAFLYTIVVAIGMKEIIKGEDF
jgi:hypothetical protein